MPVAPPAIIMVAPDIPSSFRIEDFAVKPPLTAHLSFVQADCPPSLDGEIVVCGRRAGRPDYRIETYLPPAPSAMDDIANAFIVRKGAMEFGFGPDGPHFKLKF